MKEVINKWEYKKRNEIYKMKEEIPIKTKIF